MLREGKGNLRLVIPGIPGNPGNHIKSKVKFKILFIFMPWPAIRKTANFDIISRLNTQPKLPFPGNGKGNYKMPREGKGNLRLVFPGITGNGNSRSPLDCTSVTPYLFSALQCVHCSVFLPPGCSSLENPEKYVFAWAGLYQNPYNQILYNHNP